MMDRSHPSPTEFDVRAIDARRKELHVAWFQGYRKNDVDTYLDEVVEAMQAKIQADAGLGAGMTVPRAPRDTERVTPFNVQAKEFEIGRFGRGYKMRDVDEYLDDVTDILSQLEAEHEALRAQGPSGGRR